MENLGRYRIQEFLGKGSMGMVHRAFDPLLDREVAIKTISTGLAVEPEIKERFYREAKACARLQHPAIITVFDLGESDDTAFIVMELLQGSDLRKVIASRIPVSVTGKLESCANVCDGLAHAHRHGIIHRDVKPSNIFLTESGQVKVLDFGIARLPSSRLTVAHPIMGTMNYLPPETIRGKPVDSRSDLFSAAIVFFEWLAFRHPFEGPEILKRIADDEPDSIIDAASELPVNLDRIFRRALAKDPALRYKNCDEFAADLRAVSEEMGRPSFGTRGGSLPSEIQTELVNPIPPVPVKLSTIPRPIPPPDEDPAEWYFSEVLRLLPAFEEKITSGDVPGARTVLEQLEAIDSADGRFGDALQLCRTRFSETSAKQPEVPHSVIIFDPTIPSPPPIQPKLSSQPQRPSKKCPFCEASNRLAAANCIECGAPFEPPKSEQQSPSAIAEDETKIFGNVSMPVSTTKHNNPSSWSLPASRKLKALVSLRDVPSILRAAIVTAVATSTLAYVIWCLWPVSVKPAIATARVTAWRSVLYRDASKSDPIEILGHGQLVHILTLPRSRDQEWVQAQIVENARKAPLGLVLARDLGGWDSANPDSALYLFLTFQPTERSTSGEVKLSIGQFSQWLNQHPKSTSAPKAHFALAELYLLLGRSEVDSAESRTEDLSAAEFHIKSAEVDQSLKRKAEALAKELKDFQSQAEER